MSRDDRSLESLERGVVALARFYDNTLDELEAACKQLDAVSEWHTRYCQDSCPNPTEGKHHLMCQRLKGILKK